MTPLTHSGLLYLWLTLSVVVDVWMDFASNLPVEQRVPFYRKRAPHWWNPIVVAGLLTYLVYLVQP